MTGDEELEREWRGPGRLGQRETDKADDAWDSTKDAVDDAKDSIDKRI